MLKIFILKNCPHCVDLLQWVKELYIEDSSYQDIEIEYIDEQESADIADQYDYYYVPSIFLDELKVHEGVASKEIIKSILKQVKS
jgi:glutaredoxin